jgi:hypothetical protein
MNKLTLAALALLTASAAAPALGEDGKMISASRPEQLVKAMKEAGFKAELTREDGENPSIDTEFAGWESTIYLYDCDEKTYTKCQSLLMRTGFDRKERMPYELVNEIVSKQRYMAVYLDDEGDPWADWDLITGDGIPQSVFFVALRKYAEQVDGLSERVFAEERAAEGK